MVGKALYLLLALTAQVTANGLQDAHCHTIHDVVPLYVEIGFVGADAELYTLSTVESVQL